MQWQAYESILSSPKFKSVRWIFIIIINMDMDGLLLAAICILPVIGPIYIIPIQLFMFQLTWNIS
jgi:hypothetical protein